MLHLVIHYLLGSHLLLNEFFKITNRLLELIVLTNLRLDLAYQLSLFLSLHYQILEGNVDVGKFTPQRHFLQEFVVHFLLLGVFPKFLNQLAAQVLKLNLLESGYQLFESRKFLLDPTQVQVFSNEDHQEFREISYGAVGQKVHSQKP